MKTSIRRLGNSHGLLIPKAFLAELGLAADAPVELKIKKGKLVITPLKSEGRASWADDSRRLARAGDGGAAWPGPGESSGGDPRP